MLGQFRLLESLCESSSRQWRYLCTIGGRQHIAPHCDPVIVGFKTIKQGADMAFTSGNLESPIGYSHRCVCGATTDNPGDPEFMRVHQPHIIAASLERR
jgi:hypothetical protein